MPVLVRIPTPLRGITNDQKTVEAKGKTISEVLVDLETKYPGIREKLYDRETLRPFFNLFLNNEDIRVLNRDEGLYQIGINNPVKDGDQISIIPPIAGGIGRE
jgi:molybdopterin synthase sulfur carrier subunit